MGLTLWLLDKQQKPRAAIRSGITELVHAEAAGTLTAEIPWSHAARSGEFLGLRCADGRDRLFEIQSVQEIEPEGIQRIDAQDAAWAELEKKIVVSAAIKNQKASTAMAALLAGTGWSLGTVSADGDVGNIADAEFEPVADAMERIADTAKVKLVPSYQLTGGKVTGRTIDMVSAEPVWRGRIINSRTASDIVLTEGEPPMGRVYALGGWTGTGSERQRVTINGVAWSKAAGDPVDKPAGQDWIDDPEYSAAYVREYVYTDQNATDPMQLAVDAWQDLEARRAATLTGTAKAGDVAFVAGWSHAQVQVDDLVGVRSKSGRAAQTRIAEIRRDHIFPERTQLEFGERQSRSWIQTQVARQEQQTRRMGGRMSAAEVLLEDTGVELYRAIEQIVELEDGTATEFTEVWIDLDAVAGEVTTKASQELVDSLSGSVETLSTEFVVAVDGIRATIQEGDETVATLKATIDGLEHWVTDGEGNVAELTNTVNGLTATVTAADGRIGALAVTADGISASVQDQSGRLSQLAARIDEVAANVQDADGNIGQLSVRVDAVSQTVSTADGRIGALVVTADGISASVQDQAGRMSELLVGLEEITAGVRDAEGAISRLTVEAGRIAGMMTDTSGKVTSLVEQTDKRFSAVVGDIELLEKSVDQVTGSALWQTRESITAAVGKMRVDENGKLHIVEGSGLVIDSGGSSFGVYTQGNLTAGVIVDRINGGTVQIKAEKVDLGKYATVEKLSAEIANIRSQWSTKLATQELEVSSIFKFQSYAIGRRSKGVLTSLPSFTTATVTLENGNQIRVVTGWADSPSSHKETLFYMGDSF